MVPNSLPPAHRTVASERMFDATARMGWRTDAVRTTITCDETQAMLVGVPGVVDSVPHVLIMRREWDAT